MADSAEERERLTLSPRQAKVMWIDKLADGVLQVETPIGSRYLQPSFLQRASLLWTFRNFDSLPQQVLSAREQRLIDELWRERRFVPVAPISGHEKPIIGKIERRPPMEPTVLPMRRPVASSQSPLPERSREAASA